MQVYECLGPQFDDIFDGIGGGSGDMSSSEAPL